MRVCCVWMIVALFTASCSREASCYGYVYDRNTRAAVTGVQITSIPPALTGSTDWKGYFRIKKSIPVAYDLVFAKNGYITDTVRAVWSRSGEQFVYRFGGDTIYLKK